MSATLDTLKAHISARLEANNLLALSFTMLTEEDRSTIARPPNSFLAICGAIFAAMATQSEIARLVGLDLDAIDDKLAQLNAINIALNQNEREAQILRDARLSLTGEMWRTMLKAKRLATALSKDDESARHLAKTLEALFPSPTKKPKKDEKEAKKEEAAAKDPKKDEKDTKSTAEEKKKEEEKVA